MRRLRKQKGNIWETLFSYAAISIVVGTISILLQKSNPEKLGIWDLLMNSVYSLMIGLSLFANNWLFNWVEVKYVFWIERPKRSLLLVSFIHLTYSTIAIYGVNYLWFTLILGIEWSYFIGHFGKNIIVGEYLALILITIFFYARSFFFEWRDKSAESQRLKSQAIALQYQVLQNQIDPHFLFNSLNTLGTLIDIDAEKAKQYVREFSLYYRELLSLKDKELIPLADEIQFVGRYIYLQKIRFGDNFDVQIRLKEPMSGQVIPLSVQMMVENAVKHNIISKEKPLEIIIVQNDHDTLIIENNLQEKERSTDSNQFGLKNLSDRYLFLTGKEMLISRTDRYFRVSLPLINTEP